MLTSHQLPSLIMIANPCGTDGAVSGMAVHADEEPKAENMTRPMEAGEYVAVSPAGGMCSLRIERVEPHANKFSLAPEALPSSGLTEETLAKYNRPVWRTVLQMTEPSQDVRETVIFATRVAQRLAALGDGIVMDTCAYRFFGPEGWPVQEPLPDFDAREHVHVHLESDSNWLHTHGLIKFGRPELEIYDVPPELHYAAFEMLLNTAQYVITSTIITPKQTCGDPDQPFYAREGTRNREGHWNDLAVLELVDLDERRKPIPSGAPKALQLFAAS
ncbi:MAG: hypothetical protein JWM16_1240 [Verrucomicrobiales bacterium]|nr:hypothetical protein [Verrucomicrobiales bacterium]